MLCLCVHVLRVDRLRVDCAGKDCDTCKSHWQTPDPIDDTRPLKWGYPRPIDAGNDIPPPGKQCYYCRRVHRGADASLACCSNAFSYRALTAILMCVREVVYRGRCVCYAVCCVCQAEYNSFTLTELKTKFQEEPTMAQRFQKKRKICVDMLADRCISYQFEASDFDVPEEVVSSEAIGKKKFRGGTVYPLEIFEDRFEVKKRKTISYQKEKDDDGKDTVLVFDDVPGVYRFENYEDKSTAHKKVIA